MIYRFAIAIVLMGYYIPIIYGEFSFDIWKFDAMVVKTRKPISA